MCTQIRRLLQDLSDLGLHCLSKWLYTTKAEDFCCFGALSVDKCKGQDFNKITCIYRQSCDIVVEMSVGK